MNTKTRVLTAVLLTAHAWGCGDPAEFPDVGTSRHAIIDGQPSAITDFPSAGALVMQQRFDTEKAMVPICSGTLIASDVVLTAAHCTPGDAFFAEDIAGTKSEFHFTFHPDLADYDGAPTLPPHSTAVSHLIINPEYKGSIENIDLQTEEPTQGLAQDGDIALLFLSTPVTTVTPTPILRPGQADRLQPGAEVLVAGYGQQHRSADAEDPAVKNHGPSHLHAVGDYELQVGDRASLDAEAPRAGLATKCYGDSGGPTYLAVDGQLHVVGVTSRGIDDAPDCDRAGIDTRVDAYAGWIDHVMKEGCQKGLRVGVACNGAGTAPSPRQQTVAGDRPTSSPAPEPEDGGCDASDGSQGSSWITLGLLGLLGLRRRRWPHGQGSFRGEQRR